MSSVRIDLSVKGLRVDAPVRRPAGAGPSSDGQLLIDGRATALPLRSDSPWSITEGQLFFEGVAVVDGPEVELIRRPMFYDMATSDGVPYEQIARLHGADVLATTVVQTCIRYAEAERCRFCAIESSLEDGSTVRVKTPEQLAEVALAARRLDGVRQMVMTTGTSAAADRGARYLARCTAAVVEAVPGLPVQVQCEPPDDLAVIGDLRRAGATAIGIHVESLDDEVRARWMPGKARVPLTAYRAAWREAVRVFGPNRVSTYLLVGLGEDPDELVAGARELIDMGVYPFVVPYRPLPGTLAAGDGVDAPSAALLSQVTDGVASALRSAGMRGVDQQAGCAACGACSSLADAGG